MLTFHQPKWVKSVPNAARKSTLQNNASDRMGRITINSVSGVKSVERVLIRLQWQTRRVYSTVAHAIQNCLGQKGTGMVVEQESCQVIKERCLVHVPRGK